MSYVVTINGHGGDLTPEEAEAFERKQAETVRRLVRELEGVTAAWFTGGTTGALDLRAESEA